MDMKKTRSKHENIAELATTLLENMIDQSVRIAKDKPPYMTQQDFDLPPQGPITGKWRVDNLSTWGNDRILLAIRDFLICKNRANESTVDLAQEGKKISYEQKFPSRFAPTEQKLMDMDREGLIKVILEHLFKQPNAKVGGKLGAAFKPEIRKSKRLRMLNEEIFRSDPDLETYIFEQLDELIVDQAFSGVRQTTPPWFIDPGCWDLLSYKHGDKFERHRDRRGKFPESEMKKKSHGWIKHPNKKEMVISSRGNPKVVQSEVQVCRAPGTDAKFWLDGISDDNQYSGTGSYPVYNKGYDRSSPRPMDFQEADVLRYRPFTVLICLDSNIPEHSQQGATEVFLPGDGAQCWNKTDRRLPTDFWSEEAARASEELAWRSQSHTHFMRSRMLKKRLRKHTYKESTTPHGILIFPSEAVHASKEITTKGLYKLVLKFKIWIDVGAWLGSKEVTYRKFGQKFWSYHSDTIGGKEYLGHLLNSYQYKDVAFVPNKFLFHDKDVNGRRPDYLFDVSRSDKEAGEILEEISKEVRSVSLAHMPFALWISSHPELGVCSGIRRSDLPLTVSEWASETSCGDCAMFNRSGRTINEKPWNGFQKDGGKLPALEGYYGAPYRGQNHMGSVGHWIQAYVSKYFTKVWNGLSINRNSPFFEERFGLNGYLQVARATAGVATDLHQPLEHESVCHFVRTAFAVFVEGKDISSAIAFPSTFSRAGISAPERNHNHVYFSLYSKNNERWLDTQIRRRKALEDPRVAEHEYPPLIRSEERQEWRQEWYHAHLITLSAEFEKVIQDMMNKGLKSVLLDRLQIIEDHFQIDLVSHMPSRSFKSVREKIHNVLARRSTCRCHIFKNAQARHVDPLRQTFMEVHNCLTVCGKGHCVHRARSGHLLHSGNIDHSGKPGLPESVHFDDTGRGRALVDYSSDSGHLVMKTTPVPFTYDRNLIRDHNRNIVKSLPNSISAFFDRCEPDCGMNQWKDYANPRESDDDDRTEQSLKELCENTETSAWREGKLICRRSTPTYKDEKSIQYDAHLTVCNAEHMVGCSCSGCNKKTFLRIHFPLLLRKHKNIILGPDVWNAIFLFCEDENVRGWSCLCQNNTLDRRFISLDKKMLLACYDELHSDVKRKCRQTMKKQLDSQIAEPTTSRRSRATYPKNINACPTTAEVDFTHEIEYYEREMRRFGFSKVTEPSCERSVAKQCVQWGRRGIAELSMLMTEQPTADVGIQPPFYHRGKITRIDGSEIDAPNLPSHLVPELSGTGDDYRCTRDCIRPCFIKEVISEAAASGSHKQEKQCPQPKRHVLCKCGSCKMQVCFKKKIDSLNPSKWMIRPPCECSCLVCLVREDCTLKLERRVPGTDMDIGKVVPIDAPDSPSTMRKPRNTCNMLHHGCVSHRQNPKMCACMGVYHPTSYYESEESDDSHEEHYDDHDDY